MSTNRKILVRNIPEMIYVQFEQMAAENHRSVEGQARYVLTQAAEDYFKPKDIENARKKRCRVIGQRLQCMQKNVEKAYTPSKLAYLIGDESAHFIESCFAGEEDPSFSQLEGIARIYGIRFDWLAHGTGDMFYNDYKRLPEDPKSAATWLTSNGEDVPWPKEDMVSEVFFVRNNSQAGELAIVKKSHENRWAIFRTPTHVSSEIGNGGEAMLVALFRTLRLMWSIHLRGNKEFKQTGSVCV